MQRITTLITLALAVLAASVLPSCSTSSTLRLPSGFPRARAVERAMWVTRFDYATPRDIEKAAEACKLAGMNTMMFQVRGNATASYRSAYEPWSEKFNWADPGFDPLATAIEAAHSRGLKLKAWVNVVPAWWGTTAPTDPKHVWNARKEWLWYDKDGKLQPFEDKFYVSLNPCLPEVRRYIADVMRDLVARYDVDGLHMDYIRFPNDLVAAKTDYPRDARTVKLFRGETGKTPDEDKAGWDAWRAEQVTNLVREIRRQVRQEKPDVELSAAVGPEPDRALAHHFQDVHTWVKDELVDALYPMNYTKDPAVFRRRLDIWRGIARDIPVVMGLRVDSSDVELHRQQLVASLEEFRGYCVFAFGSLFDSPNDVIENQTEEAKVQRMARREALLPMFRAVASGRPGRDEG